MTPGFDSDAYSDFHWSSLSVPRVLHDAALFRKDAALRDFRLRRARARSRVGVPLLLAALSFIAAGCALAFSPAVSVALAAVSLAWLGVGGVFLIFSGYVSALSRREDVRCAENHFDYGAAAAGGVGVLSPRDLLRFAERGQPACVKWCAANLSSEQDREAFEALSGEWAGSSNALLTACRTF